MWGVTYRISGVTWYDDVSDVITQATICSAVERDDVTFHLLLVFCRAVHVNNFSAKNGGKLN